MRRNARNWRIEDLEVVARRFGVDVDSQGGTSHVTFRHPRAGRTTVLKHIPIKRWYVRDFVEFISKLEAPIMNEFANIDKYSFTIRPLSTEDGGGFLIEYPDLPGCHSDGETPEQAIVNGRDAVRSYLLSCRKHGDPIPKPSSPAASSGQFRLRMPKSLHARLAAQAEREGVSLNMLVVAAAAQALGQRETAAPRKKSR
jgi:antitoxin HicB